MVSKAFTRKFEKSLLVCLLMAAVLVFVFALLMLILKFSMLNMPGANFFAVPPSLTVPQLSVRDSLKKNLTVLASEIGERNSGKYQKLEEAARFIEGQFREYGYSPRFQEYEVEGKRYRNIEVEVKGSIKPEEILVVGAHYDTVPGCPGADDNGTGVVSVLELSRLIKDKQFDRTVRFVAFPNEEYPYFWTPAMGSFVYAKRAKMKSEKIVAMIAIETIGYYSSQPGSQAYPVNTLGFLPDRGDFIFFVGNYHSRDILTRSLGAFREVAKIPSYGISAYDCFDDISRSDNNSFFLHGYKGYMVTDTADFRNPHYHRPSDRVETIDFDNLTRVVVGLDNVISELAKSGGGGHRR